MLSGVFWVVKFCESSKNYLEDRLAIGPVGVDILAADIPAARRPAMDKPRVNKFLHITIRRRFSLKWPKTVPEVKI